MKKDDFSHKFYTDFPLVYDDIITLHTEFEDGYVDNTFYPFLPGIYVCLNDVHAKNIPMNDFLSDKKIFLINYCISGRCEFKISENVYKYVKDNYTSVGSYTVRDEFYYPSGYYLGFEIFIYEEMFTDETRNVLKQFNINLDTLAYKYNNKEKLTLLETNISMQRLWLELYLRYVITLPTAKVLYPQPALTLLKIRQSLQKRSTKYLQPIFQSIFPCVKYPSS